MTIGSFEGQQRLPDGEMRPSGGKSPEEPEKRKREDQPNILGPIGSQPDAAKGRKNAVGEAERRQREKIRAIKARLQSGFYSRPEIVEKIAGCLAGAEEIVQGLENESGENGDNDGEGADDIVETSPGIPEDDKNTNENEHRNSA